MSDDWKGKPGESFSSFLLSSSSLLLFFPFPQRKPQTTIYFLGGSLFCIEELGFDFSIWKVSFIIYGGGVGGIKYIFVVWKVFKLAWSEGWVTHKFCNFGRKPLCLLTGWQRGARLPVLIVEQWSFLIINVTPIISILYWRYFLIFYHGVFFVVRSTFLWYSGTKWAFQVAALLLFLQCRYQFTVPLSGVWGWGGDGPTSVSIFIGIKASDISSSIVGMK